MDSRHRQEIFVFFKASGISQVLAKPRTCVISLGLKRPYCEADHSRPSTDTVKVWSYIYTLPHIPPCCRQGTTVHLGLYISFSLHV
jgi:hypothetical protein